MQSLGEILSTRDAPYLRYLSRKTEYLITQEKEEFMDKFWQYLIVEYHPNRVLPRLGERDKKTFLILLKRFARDEDAAMRKRYQALEKKIPWVLMHPEGGYFIPYEIIKTLMPQSSLIPRGFLFQLIYQMPAEEQNSLRALLARSHRARESLQHEKHPLDRALVLYIWRAANRDPAEQAVKIQPRTQMTIWQYLLLRFPKSEQALAEWQQIMSTGRRGFYRSLTLVRDSSAEWVKRYVTTLGVVPIATRRQRVFTHTDLKFRIPREFLQDKIALKSR